MAITLGGCVHLNGLCHDESCSPGWYGSHSGAAGVIEVYVVMGTQSSTSQIHKPLNHDLEHQTFSNLYTSFLLPSPSIIIKNIFPEQPFKTGEHAIFT
jgi:hypothetical protein